MDDIRNGKHISYPAGDQHLTHRHVSPYDTKRTCWECDDPTCPGGNIHRVQR